MSRRPGPMEDTNIPARSTGVAVPFAAVHDPAGESWEQDLLAFALELGRRDGEVVPFTIGERALLFVNSAAVAQHILVEQRHRYGSLPFPLGRIASAFTDSGAALIRLRQRELARPAVSLPGAILEKTAASLIAQLADSSAGGESPDLVPLFKSALLGMMTEVLFGVTFPAETVTAAAQAKALLERYRAYELPPGRIQRDGGDGRRLQAAFEIDGSYSREILARTGGPDVFTGEADGASPPAHFDDERGLSPADRMAATVSRVLMNAYNGPAIALSWLAWALARQPEAQDRIATEAGNAFGDGRFEFDRVTLLPFTRLVVHETLRLHPPAWLISRQALVEDRIGATPVSRGVPVVLSPYVLHRDERYWTGPELFSPERFDPQKPAPPPGSYLPFGLGATMCPASAFAVKELQYLIARIVQRFELEPASSTAVRPWGLISLHPIPGVALRLRSRTRNDRD